MNRQLMLHDIYSRLMLTEQEPMTMDRLCKELKCSKKSIYKLFSSKNAMLYEVFSMYKKQFLCLLEDITQFDCSETQKLVFQIKELNQNAKLFFNSHLYRQLKSQDEFNEVMIQTEKEIYITSFRYIVNEIRASENQKHDLMNILIFIGVSIKRRHTLPNFQEEVDDKEFLEMMLNLLLSYVKKEHIGMGQVKSIRVKHIIPNTSTNFLNT